MAAGRRSDDGFTLTELVVVVALTLFAGRIPLREVIGSSRLIFGLGIILMFFHFFADPGEAVYRLGPLTITDGGLRQGPIFFSSKGAMIRASVSAPPPALYGTMMERTRPFWG